MNVHRRSRLRRRSSPAGVTERLDARIRAWMNLPADIRAATRKPGSRNPRNNR